MRDMKKIAAKFKSKCAETGKVIEKGQVMYYDYNAKKCYHLSSNRAKQLESEPVPPKRPKYLDGHSKRSQAFEADQFQYEMDMADKYDPSDKFGHYQDVDPAAGMIQANEEAYFDNFYLNDKYGI